MFLARQMARRFPPRADAMSVRKGVGGVRAAIPNPGREFAKGKDRQIPRGSPAAAFFFSKRMDELQPERNNRLGQTGNPIGVC